MQLVLDKGMYVLTLDMMATLALAAIVYLVGHYLIRHVYFLKRFCIPAPVVGGFLMSLVFWGIHSSGVMQVKLMTTLQGPAMLAFFTTIGLIASLRLVKTGGKLLFFYWLLCSGLAVMQNVIGTSLAQVLDIHPLLGVLMGAVSMEGGHGAAAAFGPEIESFGIMGATAVALAAATFGLVSGGLLGGPMGRYLITKHDLKPDEAEVAQRSSDSASLIPQFSTMTYMMHIALISICICIGTMVASYLKGHYEISLPGYVGAMFTAVIVRNLNDQFKVFHLEDKIIDVFGNVSLGIFLSMALMSLKLWELADLAIPMFIILIVQVVFIMGYAYFLAFPLLGKSYDAAVMCAGMIGHGLGATPNAIANMTTIEEQYGPSVKAFLIVPLCGAFLIDLVGLPCIVWFINYFSH